MRGIEKFTGMGNKYFHYEGSRREERLKHTLETTHRYNLQDLKKGTYQYKKKRLLFIITTSQTASRECMPNRKMSNLKKARAKASGRAACDDSSTSTTATLKKKGKGESETDSLLFKLPYTLVIFDEVHKAKTGPATDPAPPSDSSDDKVSVLAR